ncbi:hypothetical protein SAMN04487957_10550 [Halomonas shengliensis]|uniref:Morphogenetic protein n=1 Tax=Halomonas shengliensis TaxID=419597 RepID=A0A1H0IAM3_9GAMM|nr:hypothetical protein [Halomonas shengliensis]SDO28514.1 hypothetical protein SAMN04487957_10550 [Halomonas shengliensis]
MKERPILFNGEMVRAILNGRKTQTRRVLKPQPDSGIQYNPCAQHGVLNGKGNPLVCRFGQPGDRLWVREAHAFVPEPAYRRSTGIYQQINPADDYEACVYRENFDRSRSFPWRPSIHMPRWASRITLEIVSVRVERLQNIDAAGASAEGIKVPRDAEGNLLIDVSSKFSPAKYIQGSGTPNEHLARAFFASLWESINGAGSWDANPWVWVVEFRRVEA